MLGNNCGANVKVYDPTGLPIFSGDLNADDIPKAKELRDLVLWSEAMVWISPEIHSNMSSCFKNQIDWIPLSTGAIRPTQGKTVAVMQVEGGSQSFNTVNNLRTLARWMRMVAIPNQVSIPTAYKMFEDQNMGGEMKDDCPAKDRVVDVIDELFKYTLLLRDQQPYMVSRYSEAKAKANNSLRKKEENEKQKKADDDEEEEEKMMTAAANKNLEACRNQADDTTLKSLQDPIIVDVRSQREIEEGKGGKPLKDSISVPFNVNGNPQSVHPTTRAEFEKKIKDAGIVLDNNKVDQAFVTHCTSGTVDYIGRAAKAAGYLRDFGYANSYNGGSADNIRRALGRTEED